MKLDSRAAKVFAFLFVLFAFSIVTPAQDGSSYRLPAGTRIRLRMEGEIGSKFSSVNDTFLTRIAMPVMVREIVAVPAGSIVQGRVTRVAPASAGGRDGRIEVRMESLQLSGEMRREIDGIPIGAFRAKRSNRFLPVLGGSGIGAALGALTGSAKAVFIGLGLGTGAGLLVKGGDIRIREDDVFEIELKKDVILPVADY